MSNPRKRKASGILLPHAKRQRLSGLSKAMGPSQILSNITFGHKYRYCCKQYTPIVITPTSVLCAAGSMCVVGNTSVVSLFSSFRVTRIQMWAPANTTFTGGASTCSVLWLGSVTPFTQDREVSDTSINPSKPAYVDAVPPKNSLASFWQTASTNGLFTLNAPQGTIVDITLALTLNDTDDGSAASSTVTTGILGEQYYLSLDPNATHYYVPQSLNTTT
jgi:hypothetical protein